MYQTEKISFEEDSSSREALLRPQKLGWLLNDVRTAAVKTATSEPHCLESGQTDCEQRTGVTVDSDFV